MPTQTQRRRRDDDEEPRRRSRRQVESDAEEASSQDEDGDVSMGGAGDEAQLIKKLVRYALACEHARIPIKRDGIREKVLGSNSRSFKSIFDGAQLQLRQVFGMEMEELPVKEKRTLKEKQKATARKANGATSSRQYVLVTTVPSQYRTPEIIAPSRAPSSREEGEYAGFYTFLISIISLSGGELSDMKLRRILTRVNASQNLPMDKTDNVLVKLVRQGYLDKVVEKSDHGEEDTVTWCVGSRGRVEVPPESVAGFIRTVWGGEKPDDLEKKISRSLGLPQPDDDAGGA
ncbi:mage family protein [Apiospora rasikravindrae]|uniref:Mage family protein n=1 Tax=Apiospora rasikravindrae TaxID=990691 RepID=A0ABR1S3T7_9PEZI